MVEVGEVIFIVLQRVIKTVALVLTLKRSKTVERLLVPNIRLDLDAPDTSTYLCCSGLFRLHISSDLTLNNDR